MAGGKRFQPAGDGAPLLRLWAYTVKPEKSAEFIRFYGPDGDWARLFARGEGYLGTELWRTGGNRFITLDRWRSAADWRRFKAAFAADYAALDARGDGLTETETDLGDYSAP